jgi:DNA-binding Lrp family transcriptional regulator
MHADKISRLLYELVKNSRRSDRDLAKTLGYSQPTVTRTRKKLEDEKYVLQYTTVPDLTKLEFEVAAFTFTQWQPGADSTYPLLEKDPRVVFIAEGNGMEKSAIIVTVHKNYTDYSEFVAKLQKTKTVQSLSTFLVALADVKKHFNLAGLEKA